MSSSSWEILTEEQCTSSKELQQLGHQIPFLHDVDHKRSIVLQNIPPNIREKAISQANQSKAVQMPRPHRINSSAKNSRPLTPGPESIEGIFLCCGISPLLGADLEGCRVSALEERRRYSGT